MTKREAVRQHEQEARLLDLGFTRDEAAALRRISMTLHRWHELECGDGNEYGSWAIERDDNGDGPPYMVHHHYRHGRGPDTVSRTRIADRESGAKKRLAAIIDRRNRDEVRQTVCSVCGLDIEGSFPFQTWHDRGGNETGSDGHDHQAAVDGTWGPLSYYIQSDPRGAALYILRPGDVPEGKEADSYYTRGICVY